MMSVTHFWLGSAAQKLRLRTLGTLSSLIPWVSWVHFFTLISERSYIYCMRCCTHLWLMGPAIAKDYAQAFSWSKLVATQGDFVAQYKPGVSFRDGLCVAQGYAEAVRLSKLAAAKGLANA